jgi:predicted GIY-YIG superfamily endonuclease
MVYVVYRFFDARGEALYCGMTRNWRRRCDVHRGKSWWSSVDPNRTVVEVLSTYTEAVEAERAAIAEEQPAHNIMGARGRAYSRAGTRAGEAYEPAAPSLEGTINPQWDAEGNSRIFQFRNGEWVLVRIHLRLAIDRREKRRCRRRQRQARDGARLAVKP